MDINMKYQVLIIEDEKELAEILSAYLEVEGFAANIASDGEEGLRKFNDTETSLVLLDIMLPKLDGIHVCKKIREKSEVPIIMISAKSGEMDKVIALGIGADDYVTKPFSPLELVARVKAQLRRFQKTKDTIMKPIHEINVGNLTLNKASYTVMLRNQNIPFTTKEFEILYLLAENINQIFSKEQIYQNVWGYDTYGDDNSVTVYINRIREKLNNYGLDYIKTVWGAGYKLSV